MLAAITAYLVRPWLFGSEAVFHVPQFLPATRPNSSPTPSRGC